MMRRILLQSMAVGPCAADQYKDLMHGYMAMNGNTKAGCGSYHGGPSSNSTTSYSGPDHNGSPIPYLLAGLAAMLALIAVSLFILACSYWKLVNYGNAQQQDQSNNSNNTTNVSSASSEASQNGNIHEENVPGSKGLQPLEPCLAQDSFKLAVIMAGHSIPTFLAKPLSNLEVKIQS